MKAWINQDPKQVKKRGPQKCSWYVYWLEPAGKRRCQSCGPGPQGRRNAEKLKKKVEAELLTGTYQSTSRMTWDEFRRQYEAKVADGMGAGTRSLTVIALDHFERIVKPLKVVGVKTQAIDDYVAARRKERGKKKESLVSPPTINRELRHLRAVFRIAHDWGCLPAVPRFKMLREAVSLPTYVTGDHFAAIYGACERARRPGNLPFSVADWWRALLVMGYMTGWRISDMLGLRRQDLDLNAGTAITRAADNKGKRDELVKLHPVVVEHLRKIVSFEPTVFPWPHGRKSLDVEFARIQQAAAIHLPCPEKHAHTDACHVYGFHDLRRAFATMNADKLSADALQVLMRHKSYTTTQRYINMARQMDAAVAGLHVPDVLRTGTGPS